MLRNGILSVFILLWAGLPGLSQTQGENAQATADYAAAARLLNVQAYDLAAKAYFDFISKYPNDPRVDQAYFNLAACYYQLKDLDRAAQTFRTLLERFPNSNKTEPAQFYLGMCYYGLAQEDKKHVSEAVKQLQTFVQKYPNSRLLPDALFYCGEALYLDNRPQEAIQYYEQLLEKAPGSSLAPEATYALGMCYQAMKQWQKARETYSRFLQQWPTHSVAAEVRLRMAEVYLGQKQYREAIQLLEQLTKEQNFPLADLALLELGDAWVESGELEKGAQAYRTLVQRFPQSQYVKVAQLAAGRCLVSTGKHDEGLSLIEPLLRESLPLCAEATQWYAIGLVAKGEAAKAVQVLDQMLGRQIPGQLRVKLLLEKARALRKMQQLRQSLQVYDQVISAADNLPEAADACYEAAIAALEIRDSAQVEKYCRLFSQRFSDSELLPDVLFVRAEGLLLADRPDEAEKAYQDLLSRYPSHSELSRWKIRYCWAMFLQRKFDRVIAYLSPLLSQLKDSALKAEAQYLIGASYLAQEKYGQAVGYLAASVAGDDSWPNADAAAVSLAQAYVKLDNLNEARAVLEQFDQRFPQSELRSEAAFLLATVCRQLGQPTEAIRVYRQLLDSADNSDDATEAGLQLAALYAEQGQLGEAVRLYDQLLSRKLDQDKLLRALLGRANVCYRQKQFERALADLDELLKKNPDEKLRATATLLRADCLIEAKRYREAEKVLRSLLANEPAGQVAAAALYRIGLAQMGAGDKKAARDTFIRLIKEHPNDPLAAEAYLYAGDSLYEGEDYKQAAVAYYRAMTQADDPHTKERACHMLGWCYYHQEQYENAEKTFQYQLKAFPEGTYRADCMFMLAECKFQQQQYDDALKQYEAVLSRAENLSSDLYRAAAFLHAGQAASQLKQWGKAENYLRRCSDQYGKTHFADTALYELGWVKQQQGNLQEALKFYQQVVQRTQDEIAARALFMMGEIYFQQKQHDDAIRQYFKVMAFGYPTWEAQATYEAARCFEVLNRKQQALQLYRQFVEKFPNDPKVPDAKQRIQTLAGG